METDNLILTGQAWVMEGSLSSEAIVSGVTQGTIGATGTLLLATGTVGEGSPVAQAAVALQQNGAAGIIAPAFAWPFFRVCLNIGLPPLTVWEAGGIRMNDRLRVDLDGQVVKNLSSGTRYPIRNLSELYVEILACGGMSDYVRVLLADQQSSGPKASD